MAFQYGTPDETERKAFDLWLRQSPAHAQAWDRAQAVFHAFGQVPADIGKKAITALQPGSRRRRNLQLLGMLLAATPAAWLTWGAQSWLEWTADFVTATGERKTITLPDGSRLVLNTASAVDIAFHAAQRRIRLLAGEILITTHADPSPAYRPFLVDTPHGVVRALGTRFSVRHVDSDTCRVAVFGKQVEIRPVGGPGRILHAGQQAEFDAVGVSSPDVAESTDTLWEQGMLLAKSMRLGDVIAEMARHRTGVLRCDPAVADLQVSGAISLADTDAGLDLLASTLSLRIQRQTRYWVTVAPRV